jgi:xylulokinase
MRDNFYQWARRDCAEAGRDIYDFMVEEASRSPPGSRGLILLPHFMGGGNPSLDPDSRGAIFGLTLAHNRGDIVRAALEGISLQLRWNVEALAGLGVRIDELRAVGGGARSPFWLQLKADVTRRRIVAPHIEETASLGAAVLSGLASKVYSNLDEAVSSTAASSSTFIPCEQDVYLGAYDIFRLVYRASRKISLPPSSCRGGQGAR